MMEGIETVSVKTDAARMMQSLVLFGYKVDPFFSFASSVSSEESSFFSPLPLLAPMRRLMIATIKITMESATMRKSPILVDIDSAGGRATAAVALPVAAAVEPPERLKGIAVAVAIFPLQWLNESSENPSPAFFVQKDSNNEFLDLLAFESHASSSLFVIPPAKEDQR